MNKWQVEVKEMFHTGFFFHENNGEFYRNDIFAIPLRAGHHIPSDDTCLWIDARQASTLDLSRECKRIIREFEP